MTVTQLLRQAALADVVIYPDHKRRRVVMWSSRRKIPSHLGDALEDRAEEVLGPLSASGFWGCSCQKCRGMVH